MSTLEEPTREDEAFPEPVRPLPPPLASGYTLVYAVFGDMVLAALAGTRDVGSLLHGLIAASPWLLAPVALSVIMVLRANWLRFARGRAFSRGEVLVSALAGGGVPVLAWLIAFAHHSHLQ